jgi:hypothetical protein
MTHVPRYFSSVVVSRSTFSTDERHASSVTRWADTECPRLERNSVDLPSRRKQLTCGAWWTHLNSCK